MRTDRELRTDVVAELNWDSAVRDEDIAISVKDGVVTLAGVVDAYAQKYAAERAVERVKGVRAIANELTVKLPGVFERSDAEIAHAAVNALRWHTQVPRIRTSLKRQAEIDADRIQVQASGSRITLTGTVRSIIERRDAERAAWNAPGVTKVDNQILISPLSTASV